MRPVELTDASVHRSFVWRPVCHAHGRHAPVISGKTADAFERSDPRGPIQVTAGIGRIARDGGAAQGTGAWKGMNEWENEVESKRRKVEVDMEKCCSNRLEWSCHFHSVDCQRVNSKDAEKAGEKAAGRPLSGGDSVFKSMCRSSHVRMRLYRRVRGTRGEIGAGAWSGGAMTVVEGRQGNGYGEGWAKVNGVVVREGGFEGRCLEGREVRRSEVR
jgi:hypothetical protein